VAANGVRPQRRNAFLGQPRFGLLLNFAGNLLDTLLPEVRGEVFPTRERRKPDPIRRRIAETLEVLASPAGRVLLRAIEPTAFHRLAGEQGTQGMDSPTTRRMW
jgi:hypothetical protein